MRVLIVGSGGREHALAWKLNQSSRVSEILVAPGNAGTGGIAENADIAATDLQGLLTLALRRHVDLVVVGPETPLAKGIIDVMWAAGVPTFGPTQAAARLESSKIFAHEMMRKYGVPTAMSNTFATYQDALDHINGMPMPVVIKADGLAAGKGVIVAPTEHDAAKALHDILERRIFGDAGERVLVQEFLRGREVSLLAFTDGVHVAPMVPSCDYKRAFDNDEGPNTGGMGCYSPPGFFDDDEMVRRAIDIAVMPIVHGMDQEGWPFQGVIYAGLMVDGDNIRVLEFNARFGDPETQVIIPRMESDLAEVLLACIDGTLDPSSLQWKPGCSVGVVLASGGYPGDYAKGFPVLGLDRVDPDVAVFHAGTTYGRDKSIVTDGGRVMSLVATGPTMAEARERVYSNVARVSFSDMMYRTDIALREVCC